MLFLLFLFGKIRQIKPFLDTLESYCTPFAKVRITLETITWFSCIEDATTKSCSNFLTRKPCSASNWWPNKSRFDDKNKNAVVVLHLSKQTHPKALYFISVPRGLGRPTSPQVFVKHDWLENNTCFCRLFPKHVIFTYYIVLYSVMFRYIIIFVLSYWFISYDIKSYHITSNHIILNYITLYSTII